MAPGLQEDVQGAPLASVPPFPTLGAEEEAEEPANDDDDNPFSCISDVLETIQAGGSAHIAVFFRSTPELVLKIAREPIYVMLKSSSRFSHLRKQILKVCRNRCIPILPASILAASATNDGVITQITVPAEKLVAAELEHVAGEDVFFLSCQLAA